MRKILLFMMVSLDGYFEGPAHDLSWHNVDREFNGFAAGMMKGAGGLLFGRRTYELMKEYWPTAKPADPDDAIVARQMNNLPKIVFSRTLDAVSEKPNWKDVTLVKGNVKEEIETLKGKPGKDLLVLGSSTLCVSLLEMGLLDELRIMVNPVAIGAGTQLFHGMAKRLDLRLLRTKKFKSGNVLMYYEPKKG